MALDTIIEVENLSFSYSRDEKTLENISFKLHRGEILGILGPNGAGKTTLLKLILGFLRGTGRIKVMGTNLQKIPRRRLARILGYVPQEHHIVFAYRVIDYVLMGRAPHYGIFSMPSRRDYERAYRILDELGLANLAEKTIAEISGGQFQLVLIARALIQEAKILLMDEPVSHLDISNAVKTMELVKKLVADGKVLGVIMTLHDPLMATLYCDKTLLLNNGMMEAYGSPSEVLRPDKLKKVYGVDFDIVKYNDRFILVPVVKNISNHND